MARITPQPPVDETRKREPGTRYGARYGASSSPPPSTGHSELPPVRRRSSSLDWDRAKHALQSAWHRVEQAMHHERRH